MDLFRTKPISQLQEEASGHVLKRALGPWNLTFLGIGAVIGAGIFVLTGQAAANHAGPAITLSFVVAGLGCFFAGLCYAEFASMIPVSGSAYTYGYATMGEMVAWIIGWDLILEYLFASATVAVGWSGYFNAFLAEMNVYLPAVLTSAPFTVQGTHEIVRSQLCVNPATTAIFVDAVTHGKIPLDQCVQAGGVVMQGILNVPAMVLIALVTILLVIGIKESATFNNAVVAIKLLIVFAVIGFGFFYVNTANWSPFIPDQLVDASGNGIFGKFGWTGIVAGAGVIFFAYIGFDAVSTAAQEAKNPQRDLPIGILASLLICTILYVLMSLVMTGLAPYKELNVPHPVFVAIDHAGPALKWLGYLVNIGAIAGLASVVLVLMMGQPRIFYSMARDGLLPEAFGRVHSKFKTPYIATIITGVAAAVISGLFPIGILGELVSIGTLLAFVIVCFGTMVLRRTSPQLARPFKTPFVPLVPILGILICGYMMYGLPLDTWLRLLVWMALGMLIYFGYSYRKSKLARK